MAKKIKVKQLPQSNLFAGMTQEEFSAINRTLPSTRQLVNERVVRFGEAGGEVIPLSTPEYLRYSQIPAGRRVKGEERAIKKAEQVRERIELGGYTRAELDAIQAERKRQEFFRRFAGPVTNLTYQQEARRTEEYPQYVKGQKALARQQAQEKYDRQMRELAQKVERGRKITKKALKEFAAPAQRIHEKAGGALKSVSKAYKYRYKMSKSLLGMASAFGTPMRGGQIGPGRPKMVYVHRSPFTGKPIPAPLWYKEMRQFKKLQQDRAEGVQRQTVRRLAQRGIPPQAVRIQPEQIQQVLPRQIQQVRPIVRPYQQPYQPYQQQPQQQPLVQPLPYNAQLPPGTVIPRGTEVWKFRRGVVGTEGGLMGRQQKVYGLPESFWN